jgi:hypothetical protein
MKKKIEVLEKSGNKILFLLIIKGNHCVLFALANYEVSNLKRHYEKNHSLFYPIPTLFRITGK